MPGNLIHIGLVNNMPDGALKATERQFLNLLRSSAPAGVSVALSMYALPEIPRSAAGRQYLSHYSSLDELWTSRLDGLIITGAEPSAAHLPDEPYWPTLQRVLDWAERNTTSTILSCLAAHAAVQHIDGISRLRSGQKRFGVFEFVKASEHFLTGSLPALVSVPHSRWNDLPEKELVRCGYQILTRDPQSGSVDLFVKQRRSLFVSWLPQFPQS